MTEYSFFNLLSLLCLNGLRSICSGKKVGNTNNSTINKNNLILIPTALKKEYRPMMSAFTVKAHGLSQLKLSSLSLDMVNHRKKFG